MKQPASIVRFLAVTLVAALFTAGFATSASAGELSFYAKSGWFTWDEKLNGSPFVREHGMIYGAGVCRTDLLLGLSVSESVEVWGGSLNYDGHDITGTTKIDSDTSYFGSKEELFVGKKLPVTETVSFEPFAGIGHRFWVRTRSGEDWNSFYTKLGLAGEYKTGWGALFVKGGALVPVYTRNHVSLTSAGYSDVVTEPKSRVSAFAEGGVKLGPYAVSIEYEGLKFGESDKVATSRLANAPGAVVQNNQAYQPDSDATLVSLKVAYSF